MALLARASAYTFQFSNNCFYRSSLSWVKLKLDKTLFPVLLPCKRSFMNSRLVNTVGRSSIKEKDEKYLVYDDAIARRRDQARRSVLVQVQSEQSSYELYDYCSRFAMIQEMHHYTVNGNLHFVLIEFKTLSDVESIGSISTHGNLQQHLPVISPMLWFRATKTANKNGIFSKEIPLAVRYGKVFSNSQAINESLLGSKSISDQMLILCNSTKLNDTDTRLRFITARQIEMCLSGVFTNISVLPFGSSVNGFGKHGCDLDLVLKLQDDAKDCLTKRLIYHAKTGGLNDRIQAQKMMETISDIMHQFLPGITGIRKILKARVPIIKYNQTLTGLECDLSMTNTVGLYMSELLYLYGELDSRVRPLVFTVRMWANCVQLTNNTPGSWITNFSLTLLVLFYLQQKKILPSLQHLVKLAKKSDIRIADGGIDCTFLRDISRLPKSSVRDNAKLEDLLTNFFIYYSSFDFATRAVSINDGATLPKPDTSSIYIYNPFEPGLNVTKNMNIQETERLKVEMRNAAWLLESAVENKSVEWGLLVLFRQKINLAQTAGYNPSGRMVELSTLFNKSSPAHNSSKNSKDTLSTGDGTVVKTNKNTVVSGETVDRQVARNAKSRGSRKQEWRR